MNFKAFLPAVLAAVALALPATSEAHKFSYSRDLDHDGHFNTKTVDFHHHGHYGGYYGGYYPGYYGYGRPYGYYGYRGYGYPYYGYGGGPLFGVSFYSQPGYYSRAYRGIIADNSLAVDVQRALRSRGYYYGSIDGVIGSGSRSAIRAYQRDRGLLVTGRIDRDLLRSLRIG